MYEDEQLLGLLVAYVYWCLQKPSGRRVAILLHEYLETHFNVYKRFASAASRSERFLTNAKTLSLVRLFYILSPILSLE